MIEPLTGKAARAVELSTARFNIWEGAVRSSKTVSSVIAWLGFVLNAPPGDLAMVGKTERTVRRNVISLIVSLVGSRRARHVVGAGELHLLGRRIYVIGANNVAAIERIQGLTLAGVYGDEIATWPEEFFEMLTTRLSVPGARLLGTCNPASPVHWLKTWLDRASLWLRHDGATESGPGDALDLHRFSFLLEDNPHLAPEFVETLKRQYTGLFHKRYILGMWVPAEGAIFDMFDPVRHVVADIPTITRWISVGVDHGTRNPFHAGVLGLGVDRKLHLVRDWRWDSAKQRRQLSDAEYSWELRTWLRSVPVPGTALVGVEPERVVVDPEATGFRVQLHQDGVPTVTADNAVLPGIRTVSTLYALDLLDVHESCVELIRETQGYSWDDKAAEKGVDKPLKVSDHGPDMKRYAAHSTRGTWRDELRSKLHLAA